MLALRIPIPSSKVRRLWRHAQSESSERAVSTHSLTRSTSDFGQFNLRLRRCASGELVRGTIYDSVFTMLHTILITLHHQIKQLFSHDQGSVHWEHNEIYNIYD